MTRAGTHKHLSHLAPIAQAQSAPFIAARPAVPHLMFTREQTTARSGLKGTIHDLLSRDAIRSAAGPSLVIVLRRCEWSTADVMGFLFVCLWFDLFLLTLYTVFFFSRFFFVCDTTHLLILNVPCTKSNGTCYMQSKCSNGPY